MPEPVQDLPLTPPPPKSQGCPLFPSRAQVTSCCSDSPTAEPASLLGGGPLVNRLSPTSHSPTLVGVVGWRVGKAR